MVNFSWDYDIGTKLSNTWPWVSQVRTHMSHESSEQDDYSNEDDHDDYSDEDDHGDYSDEDDHDDYSDEDDYDDYSDENIKGSGDIA